MYNFDSLMSFNPTKLGETTNSLGQLIEFYEHPIEGDCSPVICVCQALKLACDSDFFEIDDMLVGAYEYDDYVPLFIEGKLVSQFEIGE